MESVVNSMCSLFMWNGKYHFDSHPAHCWPWHTLTRQWKSGYYHVTYQCQLCCFTSIHKSSAVISWDSKVSIECALQKFIESSKSSICEFRHTTISHTIFFTYYIAGVDFGYSHCHIEWVIFVSESLNYSLNWFVQNCWSILKLNKWLSL